MHLRKFRKRSVGKERDVAQNLMAHVRLGRIQRLRVMPNVLRGVEDTKGEASQKVSGRQQPSYRAQAKASAGVEKLRNAIQLRNFVSAVVAVF